MQLKHPSLRSNCNSKKEKKKTPLVILSTWSKCKRLEAALTFGLASKVWEYSTFLCTGSRDNATIFWEPDLPKIQMQGITLSHLEAQCVDVQDLSLPPSLFICSDTELPNCMKTLASSEVCMNLCSFLNNCDDNWSLLKDFNLINLTI